MLASKAAHHRMDAIDTDSYIRGFAVPQPPTLSFDVVDHRRHCLLLLGICCRYRVRNLLQVVQSHRNVKPCVDGPVGSRASRDRLKPGGGTALGSRRRSPVGRSSRSTRFVLPPSLGRSHRMRGKFITVEGREGGGKTTHLRLVDALTSVRVRLMLTRKQADASAPRR